MQAGGKLKAANCGRFSNFHLELNIIKPAKRSGFQANLSDVQAAE